MITETITNVSEVAALRVSIALECEALERAMNGSATVASHASIERRYKHIDHCTGQLSNLIGEQQAKEVTVNIYESIVR